MRVLVAALCFGTLLATGCPNPTTNTGISSFSIRPAPTPTASANNGLVTTPDARGWRAPVQIDPAAVTAPSPAATPFTTALVDLALGAYDGAKLPAAAAVSGDYDGRLYVGFGLQDYSSVAASISTTAVISTPSGYGADSWPSSTSFATFTELVGGISATATTAAERGLFGLWLHEDGLGTLHAFIGRETANNTFHLFAARHDRVADNAGPWTNGTVPTRRTDATSPITMVNAEIGLCPPRSAWDSTGRGIVVACMVDPISGDPRSYYVTYDGAGTWSSPSMVRDLASSAVTYLATSHNETEPSANIMSGVDVGLDSSGNGWAVHALLNAEAGTSSLLVLERYEAGAGFTGSYRIVDSFTSAAGEGFMMPRIWMRGDGAGSVFYLKYDGGIYALYRADFASTGFLSSAPTRIDTVDTSIGVIADEGIAGGTFIDPLGQARTNYMPYQLATAGDYAGLAFVKKAALGGINRLYFTRYASSGWSAPMATDETTSGVGWASLAINASAHAATDVQYMMAYETLNAGATAGNGVRARFFNGIVGAFSVEQTIGSGFTLTNSRPTAYVTRDGKAGVVFSATVGGFRRLYVSTYR